MQIETVDIPFNKRRSDYRDFLPYAEIAREIQALPDGKAKSFPHSLAPDMSLQRLRVLLLSGVKYHGIKCRTAVRKDEDRILIWENRNDLSELSKD